jgi:hypothetical protein
MRWYHALILLPVLAPLLLVWWERRRHPDAPPLTDEEIRKWDEAVRGP